MKTYAQRRLVNSGNAARNQGNDLVDLRQPDARYWHRDWPAVIEDQAEEAMLERQA